MLSRAMASAIVARQSECPNGCQLVKHPIGTKVEVLGPYSAATGDWLCPDCGITWHGTIPHVWVKLKNGIIGLAESSVLEIDEGS